jgi:Lrp/AsnC family transcriptional regulator, leucine-responsive regulatory protein
MKTLNITSLDAKDRSILSLLQANGRISNAELAARVHLSASACLERTRHLEREGYIRHYTAVLNPEKLGAGMVIFVQVSLHDMTEEVFSAFHAGVAATPEIQACHMVSGGFDYLLKVRVADMNAYRQLLGDILSRLPHVRETHTYVVMQEVKESLEVVGLVASAPARKRATSKRGAR